MSSATMANSAGTPGVSFFSRILQVLVPARTLQSTPPAAADLESYLSQAQDVFHLEALQRQWDRARRGPF